MAARTLLRFFTLPLAAALAACGGPVGATAPATTAALAVTNAGGQYAVGPGFLAYASGP